MTERDLTEMWRKTAMRLAIVVVLLSLCHIAIGLYLLRVHPQIEHVRWAKCISVNVSEGYGTIRPCEP
jgi:hypothetical protein